MIFLAIFGAKFGPSIINIVHGEFRYHGKWGTGSNRRDGWFDGRPPYWIAILLRSYHVCCRILWLDFCGFIQIIYSNKCLFAFLLSIGNEVYDLKLKMPKTASCCCPHHKTWGHSDEVELRVATDFEVKICQIDKDSRHKGRKKRICTSCRSRIQLEEKCDKLQVRFFLHVGYV